MAAKKSGAGIFTCIACAAVFTDKSYVVRVPLAPPSRKAWSKSLGIPRHHFIPYRDWVCKEHFEPGNFVSPPKVDPEALELTLFRNLHLHKWAIPHREKVLLRSPVPASDAKESKVQIKAPPEGETSSEQQSKSAIMDSTGVPTIHKTSPPAFVVENTDAPAAPTTNASPGRVVLKKIVKLCTGAGKASEILTFTEKVDPTTTDKPPELPSVQRINAVDQGVQPKYSRNSAGELRCVSLLKHSPGVLQQPIGRPVGRRTVLPKKKMVRILRQSSPKQRIAEYSRVAVNIVGGSCPQGVECFSAPVSDVLPMEHSSENEITAAAVAKPPASGQTDGLQSTSETNLATEASSLSMKQEILEEEPNVDPMTGELLVDFNIGGDDDLASFTVTNDGMAVASEAGEEFVEEPLQSCIADPPSPKTLDSDTISDLQSSVMQSINKNFGDFFLVSRESLMKLFAKCDQCNGDTSTLITPKGLGCVVKSTCAKRHRRVWCSDNFGSLGSDLSCNQSTPNKTDRQLSAGATVADIPWSLLLVVYIANLVKMPTHQLAFLLSMVFSRANLRTMIESATTFVHGLPLIHDLSQRSWVTSVKEKMTALIICKRLVVFMDSDTSAPVACIEVPGAAEWTKTHVSDMIKTAILRLHILGARTISEVEVFLPTCMGSVEWKPLLVHSATSLHGKAVRSIKAILPPFETPIGSRTAHLIVSEIVKVFLFFMPTLDRLPEPEARQRFGIVLRELADVQSATFTPSAVDLAIVRENLNILTDPDQAQKVRCVLTKFEEVDVFIELRNIYREIVNVPCTDTSLGLHRVITLKSASQTPSVAKAMELVELFKDIEYSVVDALNVLMLLPTEGKLRRVFENIYNKNESRVLA